MRRSLIIIFIASLSVPFISVFGWLKLEKCALKKEIKHQLMARSNDEELVSFTFNRSDTLQLLEWEHVGEFEYRGEMYDIVRRDYHENQVTYHLWWDHEETALNKKLDKLTESLFDRSPIKERSSEQLTFFLSHLFLEELDSLEHPESEQDLQRSFFYLPHCRDFKLDTPCPPPKGLRIL